MAALARPARPPDVPPLGRPITRDNGAACVGGVQRCVGRGGSEWGRAAPAHPCVAAIESFCNTREKPFVRRS